VRLFESRVLRETFGAKTGEVTGGWRRLHNETCSKCGGEGAYEALVWKIDGKKPLGKPRCRWKNNVKLSSRSGMDHGLTGLM
jgi:hypothetical protein